jgi:hypothetical protein
VTNNELIKCTESVIDFLTHCDEEYEKLKRYDTPSNERMLFQLRRHNTMVIDIPLILNRKLHIQNEPLWIDSAKEFFSDHDKSVAFFEKAIKLLNRKNKLEQLKNRMNESIQYR